MLQLKMVNRQIQKDVSPHLELEQGQGYMYLIFDDGVRYNTKSIMTPYLNRMPLESWIYEAQAFAKEMF